MKNSTKVMISFLVFTMFFVAIKSIDCSIYIKSLRGAPVVFLAIFLAGGGAFSFMAFVIFLIASLKNAKLTPILIFGTPILFSFIEKLLGSIFPNVCVG